MIGLVKSKKTVYSNDEHEIVNNITGEILEKPDNVFMRRITVEDLFDEEEAEGSGIKFMSDITYVRSFRGNGVLFRNELTLQETSVTLFLQDFVCTIWHFLQDLVCMPILFCQSVKLIMNLFHQIFRTYYLKIIPHCHNPMNKKLVISYLHKNTRMSFILL